MAQSTSESRPPQPPVAASAADETAAPAKPGEFVRFWAWCGLAAIALLAMAAGFRNRAAAADPVELLLRVETLPRSSMKTYSLRLPRSGGLEINVSSLHDDEFSVYLVRNEERLQVSTHAQPLLGPFTAEHVRGCRRSSWLPAGDYRLTLVNSTRDIGGIEPVMSIYARLDP